MTARRGTAHNLYFRLNGNPRHRFLSNFAKCSITMNAVLLDFHGNAKPVTLVFTSVEQGYQYFRAMARGMPLLASRILAAPTPHACKLLGRAAKMRPGRAIAGNWQYIAVAVMHGLVWRKFQHPPLQEALLQTGRRTLIEVSSDRFWGNGHTLAETRNGDPIRGQNVMGRVLDNVRAHLRGPTMKFRYLLGNYSLWDVRDNTLSGHQILCLPNVSTELLFLLATIINTEMTSRIVIQPSYVDCLYGVLPWNMSHIEQHPEAKLYPDGTPPPRVFSQLKRQLRLSLLILGQSNSDLERLSLGGYLPQPFFSLPPLVPEGPRQKSQIQELVRHINATIEFLVPEMGDQFRSAVLDSDHFPDGYFVDPVAQTWQRFLNAAGRHKYLQVIAWKIAC